MLLGYQLGSKFYDGYKLNSTDCGTENVVLHGSDFDDIWTRLQP